MNKGKKKKKELLKWFTINNCTAVGCAVVD